MIRILRATTLLLALLLSDAGGATEPAPTLVVATLDGASFDLAALRGHPVIINFWATWCVPCRAEMPVLSAYYRLHRDAGLVMLGLSVDRPADLAAVRRVAAGVSYPVALAQGASRNGFPPANVLPVTYLIDAGGAVRARLTADAEGLTGDRLAALADPLLAAPYLK